MLAIIKATADKIRGAVEVEDRSGLALRSLPLCVVLAVGLALVGVAPAIAASSTPVAFVTNYNGDSVLPIRILDGEDFELESPIATGWNTDPAGIAADPFGEELFVALSTEPPNAPGTELDVIDAPSGEVLGYLEAGPHPWGVATDGEEVFVANRNNDSVDDYWSEEGASGEYEWTDEQVSLRSATPDEEGTPKFVAIAPSAETAYVTLDDYDASLGKDYSSLVPVNIEEEDTLGTPIGLPACNPEGLAITPGGGLAVVACAEDAVDVVALSTDAVTSIQLNSKHSSSGIGLAHQVAITPDGETALVTWENDLDGGVVNLIDLKTLTVTHTLTIPEEEHPQGIAVTPDGTTALIAGNGSDRIFVLQGLGAGTPEINESAIEDGEYTGPLMIAMANVPLPVAVSGAIPVIVIVQGEAVIEGQTLSVRQASWEHGVTGTAYQWLDCDSSGAGCRPVVGATESSYDVRAADVGHTLRVQETVYNLAGQGPTLTSGPTGVVQPAPKSAPPPQKTMTTVTTTTTSTKATTTHLPNDENEAGTAERLVSLLGLSGSLNAADAPVVQVALAKPTVVIGTRLRCPPACRVIVTVFAVGQHHKKIKLGRAKFKVPKDKRKHKLKVRLSKKARRLLAKDRRLHLKIHYKISSAKKKSKPTTLISSLTLKARHRRKRTARGTRRSGRSL